MNPRPQGSIFPKSLKKVLSKSDLRPEGSLFTTWSLDHFVSSVPMVEYLSLYIVNIWNLCYYHTNSRRLRNSCTIGLSLCSYTLKFCHWLLLTRINLFFTVNTTKNILSTWSEDVFTSYPNNFKPESNSFTPNSNNPFCPPGLGLIKSLSSCAINPKLHLLW